MSVEEVLKVLKTSKNGLSEKEARRRLNNYGKNIINEGKKRTIFDIFLAQFNNTILILLIIAAIISFLIGGIIDGIAISLAVILNILFGVILEYNADRSVEKLKKMVKSRVLVLRDGEKKEIDSSFLVPGDIVLLQEGQKIPVDIRIIEEKELEVNESILTGESYPVKKKNSVLGETDLVDRINMLYAGTHIIKGECLGVVVRTGEKTEFGKISRKLKEIEKIETPLQKKLKNIGKILTLFSLILSIFIFIIGFFTNKSLYELFLYNISLIVAIVPEGMLTTLTIILTVGIFNMAKEKAIVRKMFSVETLGNVNFIATDKTGTITEGRMVLRKIFTDNIYDFSEIKGDEEILKCSYLCNSAHITNKGELVGDEIDVALLKAAKSKRFHLEKYLKKIKKISFTPFDYNKKMMSGIYEINNKRIEIFKGAPESILKISNYYKKGNKIIKLNKEEASKIISIKRKLSLEGMRLIAVAYKENKKTIFLGILAFFDRIRPNIRKTMNLFKKAGIKVMVLTGDSKDTALTIGKEIGLVENEQEVKKWDDINDLNNIDNLKIIARATPFSKLKVIESLLKKYIVGVTGDGVNDALALKKANLGIAMGSGADVTKEVADIVLMDDNFSTLIKAIIYGRSIVNNILNFLKYEIAANLALVLITIPSILSNLILNPIQILWINLIIDGPPALTLAFEKPKGLKKYSMGNKFWISLLLSSFYMFFITYLVYLLFSSNFPEEATSAAFTVFVFMQAFNLLNNRDLYSSFYSKIKSNKYIFISFFFILFSQILILYTPINIFFKINPLPLNHLFYMFLFASTILVFEEIRKYFIKD